MESFKCSKNRSLCFGIFSLLLFLLGSVHSSWGQTPPAISQANFTKFWVDSEEVGNPGEAAWDGSTDTFWHTEWQTVKPPHPHSLQVDLGGVYSIGGIRYAPRTVGGANGRIGQYEVYVATNSGTPPTKPPVLAEWSLVASGTFPNTSTEQEVLFNAEASRYIWLRALSEAQDIDKPVTHVGEFNVLGTATSGPLSISPATAEVPALGEQQFIGSGGTLCPSGNYAFALTDDTTGGAIIGFSSGLYTAGPNSGTSTIRMADCSNPELAALATVTVTSGSSGGPPPAISQANFTKYWVDSEEAGTPGEAAFDGTTSTFWHTEWQTVKPPHPHSLQVDLGGVYSIGGIRYAPRTVGGANGRIGQYEVYVATNSGTPPTKPPVLAEWSLVASGTFPNSPTEQEKLFGPVTSRYIWLRALSEAQDIGKPVTHVGEFNVLGSLVGGGGSLGISPSNAIVAIGGEQAFSGVNGTMPYSYSLAGDTTGGANVNSSSGLYTAGPSAGTSTVRVTDAGAFTADAGVTVTAAGTFLDKGIWSVHFVNSQASGSPATNAFDGNSATAWRTVNSVSPPHEIQINLGDVFEIEGFRLSPLTPYGASGISFYEFFVSKDGVKWGDPIASGEFANDTSLKTVTFPRITGRYVRLIARGSLHGHRAINLPELDVIGAPFSGNHDPDGAIDSPTGNVTINVGQSVFFSGTYSDPNGDPASSFLWSFGDPAISNSTIQNPGQITFNNVGTYTVSFTVTDSLGKQDPFPGKTTVKVGSNTVLPRADWGIKYVNSEEVILANNAATNALDGNFNTLWHTQWKNVEGPHEIQIDLGAAFEIDALRYLPRPSGSSNGRIKNYHIYVSQDGNDWGQPVAIGEFPNSEAEQRVQFSPKTGRFVRLAALSEVNNERWASMAELNIEGRCQNPFVKIVDPLTKEVQALPYLKVSSSVCLTQPAHAGWGVKYSVNNGDQEKTIILPADGVIHPNTFQWTFTGLTGDNHQVEAFIVDSGGTVVPGSTTYDKVTNIGLGDVFGTLGDSITVGIGDDDPSDGTSQDGRNTNTERGFIPKLNDLLTLKRNYPHNIYNDGIQGETSAGILIRVPGFIKKRPKATKFLLLVGTNDADSGLVPSGAGQNPPNPGTFKDNLQKIINLVNNPALGREVYLAKVPFSKSLENNPAIQGYNQAINELVTANGIPVVPPDFYTHFETHQNELIDNVSHPNGLGFKSMSSLWCEAISAGACSAP
ncbi:MAG: discoidin domain-containing protein [Nitrospirales bacterium]